MKIASERSINRSFCYVNKTRGTRLNLPISIFEYKKEETLFKETNRDKIKIFEIDNFINIDCFKMIDILTDKYLKIFYKNNNDGEIPKSPYNYDSCKITEDELKKLLNKKQTINLEFSDQEICNNYYFMFNKVTNSNIHDILMHLCETNFKLYYNCRVYKKFNNNKEKFYYFTFSNLNSEKEEYQNFFNLEIIDENKGKNGKVYERLYRLKFESQFSKCFLQNIKNINIDWFPSEYYKLLTNNELIFYKFFILPFYNLDTINISLYDVKSRMNIVSNIKFNSKRFTELILESLKQKNVIKNYMFSNFENFTVILE